MTRHALLALIGMMLALWAFARACNPPHPAESQGNPSATWAPGQADPRGLAWLPVAGATIRYSRTVGDWRWDRVAVVKAEGKPTPAPTPTRTATPTPTRPPRATRTARATGTPEQGRMNTVPACGPGTLEPGPETPHPGCWPYGPPFTPTPAETETPTPRDTPPATATWEPTPTAARTIIAVPGMEIPPVYLYRFPLVLVWRQR